MELREGLDVEVSFITTLDSPASGGLVRPIHVQPLVTKCRVEPTDLY